MADTTFNDIFLDKIRLSALVVDKEGQLIGSYNNLIRKLNCGFVEIKNISTCEDYANSWRILKEIYDFLQYNKVERFKVDKKEQYELIKSIIKRYNELSSTTFKDLQTAYEIIREIISDSGYHEDVFKRKGGSLDDEEY